MKITLPFPDWDLSPNSTTDRRSLTGKRKAQKWEWSIEAGKHVQAFNELKGDRVKIPIALLFYPPNGNRRDRDNCLGACKAGLDALSKKFGIDDSNFAPILVDIVETCPPKGKVELYVDNVDMVLQYLLRNQK